MNEEIIRELDKILPVVERVHGDHHPELHEVASIYAALKAAPSRDIFDRLQAVTNNYAAPEDACPTYEKTYARLRQLSLEWA